MTSLATGAPNSCLTVGPFTSLKFFPLFLPSGQSPQPHPIRPWPTPEPSHRGIASVTKFIARYSWQALAMQRFPHLLSISRGRREAAKPQVVVKLPSNLSHVELHEVGSGTSSSRLRHSRTFRPANAPGACCDRLLHAQRMLH